MGSEGGGRVVIPLHARVSNHGSVPYCNKLGDSRRDPGDPRGGVGGETGGLVALCSSQTTRWTSDPGLTGWAAQAVRRQEIGASAGCDMLRDQLRSLAVHLHEAALRLSGDVAEVRRVADEAGGLVVIPLHAHERVFRPWEWALLLTLTTRGTSDPGLSG